jgi:Flp pilus assembly pilin Flp
MRIRRADGVLPFLTAWILVCALSVLSGLLSTTWTGITVRLGTLGSQVERQLRDIAEKKRAQAEREQLISELQNALACEGSFRG